MNSNYQSNIITPQELKNKFPMQDAEKQFVSKTRKTIMNIIHGHDSRLLVICGPCSIHDIDATLEYAHYLKKISLQVHKILYIVMRVYLEKPRTTSGWKGLIYDPYIQGSCNIEDGLVISRNLLLKLVKIGLPLATEVLNGYIPQYIGDLFSWSSIGARTTESQIHREIASGLPTTVGFKNGTDGNIETAINAIRASLVPHCFININQNGQICICHTNGNAHSHIILRGGSNQPNYYAHNIYEYEQKISSTGLPIKLMIDCSHGNSSKDYQRQIDVAQSVLSQIKSGNRSIIGLMLESYIHSGNQSSKLSLQEMRYGVSITDSCISWEQTYTLLHQLCDELQLVLFTR